MDDLAAAHLVGDPLGHLVAEVGEVEAVPTPVEDALGVVHLTVAQQVHDGLGLRHGQAPVVRAVAAAAAAAGRASRIADTARSSWAADTNQHSKADGGR